MQVQEAQRVLIKINPKRPTSRHITSKMAKFKDKETILKAAREIISYIQGALTRPSADFSTETMQARRDWHEIFQVMKSKDIQVRPLYLERHSFKMKSEIKSFPDTPPPKRLKKVHLHQTSISRDAKGATLRRRNGEREEHRYRGEE